MFRAIFLTMEFGVNKVITSSIVVMGLLTAGVAMADGDKKANKMAIKYRQAQMTLIGANFKPVIAMLKGEAEWNADAVKGMAADLAAVVELNGKRGFPKGSDEGKTKAKKAIWENMEDFGQKMGEFKTAALKFNEVAQAGDKATIGAQVKELGKTCKACHKEYKKK